ncbi:MAG: PadR family transcriptional regulator [Pseudomonadota bacterium]
MTPSKTEYLILDLLRAGGELYGLELVHRSDGALKRGTVYVTLGRMVEKKYLTAEEEKEPSHPGLPRKRYRITGLGQAVMNAEDARRAALGSAGYGYA